MDRVLIGIYRFQARLCLRNLVDDMWEIWHDEGVQKGRG